MFMTPTEAFRYHLAQALRPVGMFCFLYPMIVAFAYFLAWVR